MHNYGWLLHHLIEEAEQLWMKPCPEYQKN